MTERTGTITGRPPWTEETTLLDISRGKLREGEPKLLIKDIKY